MRLVFVVLGLVIPVLQLSPTPVTGRLVAREGTLSAALGPSIGVSLKAAPTSQALALVDVGVLPQTLTVSAPLAADRTFRVSLYPGLYSVDVSGLSQGWGVIAVVADGLDVMDSGVSITQSAKPMQLEVILSPNVHRLRGTVGISGGPPNLFVVAFSTNRELWVTGTGRVRRVKPGNGGAFEIAGLPDGEYYVGLSSNVWNSRGEMTSVLGRLARSFQSVLVKGGDAQVTLAAPRAD
jgi:hypothetical protein